MSAPISSHSENRFFMDTGSSSLEIVKFSPRWRGGLKKFFRALSENGDINFFCPHPTDEKTISDLAHYNGRDLYYVIVEEGRVLGYGLLRGWDEGYQVPSLGIAIHPMVRGKELGKILMSFLHVVASRRGADKVRLRVLKNNEKAISFYKRFSYIFEEDSNQAEYLVGFKLLDCSLVACDI